tara:strand:+ start:307 stop:723 length:417 start_codon:yes stop_codon:yes gene_type:complete
MGNYNNLKIKPKKFDLYGNIKDLEYKGRIDDIICKNNSFKFIIIAKINREYRKYICKGYGFKLKDTTDESKNECLSIINGYINKYNNDLNIYFNGIDENGTMLVTVSGENSNESLNDSLKFLDTTDIEINYDYNGQVL